ncbi:pyridoxamine 5'-phosphate oxidase family protein [Vallitalea okinawensis]|uniref:pyridoxamine 5'-phosphate oxidase family protein n=1 Tax=Vallitalea okinawensis TaxID=2078660 RepID=UPI000CFB3C9A|nr:pyridoxamine 5'-phosphate oxidase family protein [Vallitalea okinawensis]
MKSKDLIKEVLNNQLLMTLSTVTREGNAKSRLLEFAINNDNNALYILTHNQSNKINEIKFNEKVYITIYSGANTLDEIAGISYINIDGIAKIIDEKKEFELGTNLVFEKYPMLKDFLTDLTEMNLVKVIFSSVFVPNETGMMDEIKY